MGGLFNSGSKAARELARNMNEQAKKQAAQDRLAAEAAQQTRETMINQARASERAAEITNQPVDKVDVQVGEAAPVAEIDPNTGRRRTTRSSFQMTRRSSGLVIN